jgi:hypothetical protein
MHWTTMTRRRHSRSSMLSSSWPMSNGTGGCQLPPYGTQRLPQCPVAKSAERAREQQRRHRRRTTAHHPREGVHGMPRRRCHRHRPFPWLPLTIDARAVQGLTRMMTTTLTTTKSPDDPSLRPNCAAASHRRAPARAAPTISRSGVSPTRQITRGVPPAGPRLCHHPRGHRPADGDNAFEGTARCRCCCRCQPPPPGRCHPSSPPPSPPLPSILLLHLPLPGIKLVAKRRCQILTMKAQHPFIRMRPVNRSL